MESSGFGYRLNEGYKRKWGVKDNSNICGLIVINCNEEDAERAADKGRTAVEFQLCYFRDT